MLDASIHIEQSYYSMYIDRYRNRLGDVHVSAGAVYEGGERLCSYIGSNGSSRVSRLLSSY